MSNDQSTMLPTPWEAIEAQINKTLSDHQILPLVQAEAFLLYLVVVMLYDEGVKPTAAEILVKLKEHNASPELCRLAFVYYYAQSDWYHVEAVHCGLNSLSVSEAIALLKSFGSFVTTGDREDAHHAAALSGTYKPDVSVCLRRTPTWWLGWVDPRDRKNYYGPNIWLDLLDFLVECSREVNFQDAVAKGLLYSSTRYALAKALKLHGPESIRRLRLGDVAHLTQLAIVKGYLAYQAGTIQPPWISPVGASSSSSISLLPLSKLGKELSVVGMSDASTTTSDPPLPLFLGAHGGASSPCMDPLTNTNRLHELRTHLKAVMDEHPRVLLSQIKNLIKLKSGMELIPAEFGYNKVSELLIDQASDICALVRLRSRHVFAERVTSTDTTVQQPNSRCRVQYHRRATALSSLYAFMARNGNDILWILNDCWHISKLYPDECCDTIGRFACSTEGPSSADCRQLKTCPSSSNQVLSSVTTHSVLSTEISRKEVPWTVDDYLSMEEYVASLHEGCFPH